MAEIIWQVIGEPVAKHVRWAWVGRDVGAAVIILLRTQDWQSKFGVAFEAVGLSVILL
jgi:hypothetical protein